MKQNEGCTKRAKKKQNSNDGGVEKHRFFVCR
jgi:hypothetical protein